MVAMRTTTMARATVGRPMRAIIGGVPAKGAPTPAPRAPRLEPRLLVASVARSRARAPRFD
eukprot:7064729-Pyramimonas_sp.AAC.1